MAALAGPAVGREPEAVTPRTVAIMLAQSVGVIGLSIALGQAVETAPPRFMAAATPTPCEMRTIDLAHLKRTHTQACSAADATATAYVLVSVTPCDPWADENLTPIPHDHGLPGYLSAPCSVVASNATWDTIYATRTAGIIDGSYYGFDWSNGAPNWTPTILVYGTVPPEELAGYPATWTAMPQETPAGWHLDGDHWVADDGRRP